VLVIDDDPHLGALVARMLRREHEVAVATSAGEALDRIGAGERFDLILCDLMMPGSTGVDFHERLAPMAPEQLARVVYMTGGAFSPRSREFLERPSIRWIEKPFGFEELRRLVQQHAP
jgi:CheY-like chemotaxis protein